MNREIKNRPQRTRRIGASASLFALLLIYAPMASATLMAASGACCKRDLCPIHGNHHPAQTGSSQKQEDVPMDCGHEGHDTGKMNACLMSCCQTVEQTAVHAYVFVLTPLAISTRLTPLSSAWLPAAAAPISPLFAPQAPPPKSPAA